MLQKWRFIESLAITGQENVHTQLSNVALLVAYLEIEVNWPPPEGAAEFWIPYGRMDMYD